LLYVTTCNHQDAFTTNHVLTQSAGADMGLYLPLRFPELSGKEIQKLTDMSFGQCVARMLNLFFSGRLNSWDVDFSIGRYPVRMEQPAYRILMTETWHNPNWQYGHLEKNLRELLCAQADAPGNWVSIAIRMAVLAGILGNPEIQGRGPVDISVVCGDFTLPISAWYLRKMGFPIGNIICCCNENNSFWELLCNGQMHTDMTAVSTVVPEADVALPVNLERLIYECGGATEAERYRDCCKNGTVYSVTDDMLEKLRTGLYACVISSNRVETTIPNAYKTYQYVLTPSSALAYSGLLDYRTKTGITRTALVICDRNPVCDAAAIAKVMEISVADLNKMI